MAGNLEFIKSETSGSAVSSFSVDNIFSADYDVYMLNLNLKGSGSALENITSRLLDSSGSAVSTSTYDTANLDLNPSSTFGQNRYVNVNAFQLVLISQTDKGNSAIMYVYNPFDSSSYTFTQIQSGNYTSSFLGRKAIGVEKTAQSNRGIQFLTGGTMNTLEVNVYGVK